MMMMHHDDRRSGNLGLCEKTECAPRATITRSSQLCSFHSFAQQRALRHTTATRQPLRVATTPEADLARRIFTHCSRRLDSQAVV
jgi:hypothetical protein